MTKYDTACNYAKGLLIHLELPEEVTKEVRTGDELLIHNFVQTTTENGRTILFYGHNSTVAKALAKPANMVELAVKSIHSQIEEIVRSSFMMKMMGGEVEYIYSYIEETKSYYVRVIFPSLRLDEVRSIYSEIRRHFETATTDALVSECEKQGSFKIAFLIGKFPKKYVDHDSCTFRFGANYPNVFERKELKRYE